VSCTSSDSGLEVSQLTPPIDERVASGGQQRSEVRESLHVTFDSQDQLPDLGAVGHGREKTSVATGWALF
jgi:hypothetical protein